MPYILGLNYYFSIGFDHIVRTVKNLCGHLELILQDQEIDADLRVKNLNLVKMTMYLFTQIMKTKDAKLAADVSISTHLYLYIYLLQLCTF